MGKTPIREIQKATLKNSQADERQGIDCHEKGQRPVQPIFPLSPKSGLAGWLDLAIVARLYITEPIPTCVTFFAQSIRFRGVNCRTDVDIQRSAHVRVGFIKPFFYSHHRYRLPQSDGPRGPWCALNRALDDRYR